MRIFANFWLFFTEKFVKTSKKLKKIHFFVKNLPKNGQKNNSKIENKPKQLKIAALSSALILLRVPLASKLLTSRSLSSTSSSSILNKKILLISSFWQFWWVVFCLVSNSYFRPFFPPFLPPFSTFPPSFGFDPGFSGWKLRFKKTGFLTENKTGYP